ncbi:hypothetical protein ACN47E_004327 [Coniothyrium glycines]
MPDLTPTITTLLKLHLSTLELGFYEDVPDVGTFLRQTSGLCNMVYSLDRAIHGWNVPMKSLITQDFVKTWIDNQQHVSINTKTLSVCWAHEDMEKTVAQRRCEHYQTCAILGRLHKSPTVETFVNDMGRIDFVFDLNKSISQARAAKAARKKRLVLRYAEEMKTVHVG